VSISSEFVCICSRNSVEISRFWSNAVRSPVFCMDYLLSYTFKVQGLPVDFSHSRFNNYAPDAGGGGEGDVQIS
jgi:hypothetical protein